MKNVLLILFILTYFSSFAQKELSVGDDYWSGVSVYQNGTKISLRKAMEIAKNNQKVVEKLASAKSNRTIGSIISLPGAFVLGFTAGTSIVNKNKANWTVGGIGGFFMIIGEVVEFRGNKQLKEAVTEFNNASKTVSYFKPAFFMTCNENGIGIVTRF